MKAWRGNAEQTAVRKDLIAGHQADAARLGVNTREGAKHSEQAALLAVRGPLRVRLGHFRRDAHQKLVGVPSVLMQRLLGRIGLYPTELPPGAV